MHYNWTNIGIVLAFFIIMFMKMLCWKLLGQLVEWKHIIEKRPFYYFHHGISCNIKNVERWNLSCIMGWTQWAIKPQIGFTTSINLILTSCWCQIAHIIWTSTHEVNIMSRMCLEHDHWQNNWWTQFLVEKTFYVNVRHQFDIHNFKSQKVAFWPMDW